MLAPFATAPFATAPLVRFQTPVNTALYGIRDMGSWKTLFKVVIQDILIIMVFLAVSCGLETLMRRNEWELWYWVFVGTWPILFLLMFYSNVEILSWVKNDYIWSLGAGIPTLIISVLVIMSAVHRPCTIPLVQ